MYFAMNLMIVSGMFVCSSFLISVCMFIVSRRGGGCFVPVLHGCVWYVCCYVGKKAH